jgi:hypothetical protein
VFVVVAVLQRAQQSLDLGAADIQHLLEVRVCVCGWCVCVRMCV